MHLFLARDEVVILDMEAGIEHIGRGTATGVDAFIIMLEASRSSIETGRKIAKLAGQIGIKKIFAVGNKIRNVRQEEFIRDNVDFAKIAALLPYSEEILWSSMEEAGQVKVSSYQIIPTGPNQPVTKGDVLDEKLGQWRGVNEFLANDCKQGIYGDDSLWYEVFNSGWSDRRRQSNSRFCWPFQTLHR